MAEDRKRRKAPSPRHPRTEQLPEDDPVIRLPWDDGARVGPVSNGVTRIYTFGQLLADLKRKKPIRKGNVNFFDEHQLRTECARRCAADLTHESVVVLRNGLCRKLALSPTEIDALDAQAVIDLISDVKRLSLEQAIQYGQDAVAHNQYLIEYVHVGMGVWQPVFRADCLIVDGKAPTLCPDADPVMPVDHLGVVEDAFRQLRLLKPGQTVHWVGARSSFRDRCRCFDPKLVPEPALSCDGHQLSGDGIKPQWKDGILSLGEAKILKVRKKGSKMYKILDVFEEMEWEKRVDSPFPRGHLKQHLDNLRKNLKDSPIEIYGNDDDDGLCWRLR